MREDWSIKRMSTSAMSGCGDVVVIMSLPVARRIGMPPDGALWGKYNRCEISARRQKITIQSALSE